MLEFKLNHALSRTYREALLLVSRDDYDSDTKY